MRLVMLSLSLIPIVLASTGVPPKETENYTFLKVVHGDEETTFYQYRDECNRLDSDLVIVRNQQQQDAINELLRDEKEGLYFLGALRLTVQNHKRFYWLDGTRVNFTAWNKGAPNNDNGNEDAIAMSVSRTYPYYAGWEDTPLNKEWEQPSIFWKRRGAICGRLCKPEDCERKNITIINDAHNSVLTESEENGIGSSNKGEFIVKVVLGDNNTTYAEYREICQKLGADLGIIKTQAQQDAVSDVLRDMTEGIYFLGAKQSKDTKEWKWLDGTPLEFTAWREGAPDNTDGIEDTLSYCVAKTWKGFSSGWEDVSENIGKYAKDWDKKNPYWTRRGAVCTRITEK